MKKILICMLMMLCMILPVHAEEIDLESDYYLLIDADNQQILMQQGADELIYPASMTKMMTLIIALENVDDHDEMLTLDYEVFKGLYEANASLAGFSYNEQVSVKDCLYGLFLPSGAECTRALAIKTAGSEEAFVQLMNENAQQLNMKDTHFVNTTGLHDKDHVTTLNDLLKLMQYCLKNEDFYEIFTTKEYIATSGTKHKELMMNSTLFKRLNKEDAQLILGGKTGYTNPAGLCLASLSSKDGRNLILITAHAPVSTTPYHLLDAVNVYRYIYENTHKINLCELDDEIIEVDVQFTRPETSTVLYPETTTQLTFGKSVTQDDFDALWGHRRNPEGYAKEIELFDRQLGELLEKLTEDDCVVLTADHGNDPVHHGTDHTREMVPLIITSKAHKGAGLLRPAETFANLGATVADNFDVEMPEYGTSYLSVLK